ncbi:MAG TPA: DNA polymerase III subunit gamma/tau [Rhizobiales bacterium]|nr:DNA polymerase III subunit tau [bacterium BMS3Bbin10]HDO52092.1 DNA polymerase III subunit gamma/tau [Hyphomicrobiales bacterium]
MAKPKKPSSGAKSTGATQQGAAYAVLARKYRPKNFDELIGQDAMVRTLTNAFASGRIAQAYMLTGVRGVGKTTTARILARALNYEREGVEGPTIEMGEMGEHCAAIMESRHVDVLEMDAASHTGIDDIREIIESVRYKPVAARTKVYIIDEVHMLSRQAFNGLLKTLEEPPEHVRFIFATTEIRKVPVTVLSRCQRFDLRRVDVALLRGHFARIAMLEKAKIDDDALTLIARASEGSVRDGLSILDQAIAHGRDEVTGGDVRVMLGLADRARVFELLETVFNGDARGALEGLRALYTDGAEPVQILGDLAECVHVVTRIAAAGKDAADPTLSEAERGQAEDLAGRLDIGALARAWQMLLKGLEEAGAAPHPLAAAEMVLVRLAYMAGLPSPKDLARVIAGDGQARTEGVSQGGGAAAPPAAARTAGSAQAQPVAVEESAPETASLSRPEIQLRSFNDVIALVDSKRERKLGHALEHDVRLIRFAPRHIEIKLLDGAPRMLPNELGSKLKAWTGEQWIVAVTDGEGEETIAEKRRAREREEAARKQREIEELKQHPALRAVFEHFPEARITDVRKLGSEEEDR